LKEEEFNTYHVGMQVSCIAGYQYKNHGIAEIGKHGKLLFFSVFP
jgi:hypothetical protein